MEHFYYEYVLVSTVATAKGHTLGGLKQQQKTVFCKQFWRMEA